MEWERKGDKVTEESEVAGKEGWNYVAISSPQLLPVKLESCFECRLSHREE